MKSVFFILLCLTSLCCIQSATAQIGRRFPSEKKIVKDPVTGVMLTFLTSSAHGDAKIYQTHNQWTSDGEWLIFRSNLARGEAIAVNEKTGELVQVTEGGYTGMLNIARKSMKLYFMRFANAGERRTGDTTRRRNMGPLQIIEVDLAKLFADSKSNTIKSKDNYQKVCGVIPS